MRGVTFIGMPCSGKSTLGRTLAAHIKWSFIDLDLYIKERAKTAHSELLRANGVADFLRFEEACCLELTLNDTVLALGGSMVYCKSAMQKLQAETTVVYLDFPLKVIEKRVAKFQNNSRGIVGLEEKGIAGIYAERCPLYEKYAAVTLRGPWERPEPIAKQLAKQLRLQ